MSGLRYGTASIGVAVLLVGVPRSAQATDAGEPLLAATMTCDRAVEPGRVKCTLEARAAAGRTLAWADATIVGLPELATALKGRIGPADATAREPGMVRWAFGLVAKRAGEGEAKVRVRAVVCEGERCVPITVDAKGVLRVG